jgi:EmrB/QacA subfamily drug resistance transporter
MPKHRQQPHQTDVVIWRVALVAISGAFLTQLDATIVNVSLTSLARDLHSDLATIQWVTSAYLLALALALPLSGWLVDRVGAKRVYLVCFAAFTAASTLCGLAWSAPSLIGFRVIQGLSGGLLAPMTQMMMARAAGDKMARVMGYAAMPILIAPVLGPVVAGLILQHGSWRWLFLLNLPFGVAAIACAVLFLPDDRGEKRGVAFDFLGFALLSPGLVLFSYAIDRLADGEGRVELLFSLGLIAAFVLTARRKPHGALIDLELFRRPSFSVAVLIQFLSNGNAFAGQMLLPIYLVTACAFSPSKTGLLIAPVGIGMLCCYPMLGMLTDKFGIRYVAVTGASLTAAATIPLVVMASGGFEHWTFVAALFVRGIGMSMIGIPSVSAAYASLPRHELPMASTALNIVQRLGGPFMTTACATFLGWRLATTSTALGGSPYAQTFALLCTMQLFLLAASFRLPLRLMSSSPDSAVPATAHDESRI